MTINVHHLHDEDSRALAQMIVEALKGSKAIAESNDDLNWSGVRIFDEDSQRWLTTLKWVRGSPRDLDQAAYQLIKACTVSTADRLHEMRSPHSIAAELGIENPQFHRPRRKVTP
jgi:hypothetical protein